MNNTNQNHPQAAQDEQAEQAKQAGAKQAEQASEYKAGQDKLAQADKVKRVELIQQAEAEQAEMAEQDQQQPHVEPGALEGDILSCLVDVVVDTAGTAKQAAQDFRRGRGGREQDDMEMEL